MADDKGVQVTIDAKDFQRALDRLPRYYMSNMVEAGQKVGKQVLITEGLRTYPPVSSANFPPTPYYIRGQGTQYKSYNKGESEQYGTRWNVKSTPSYVRIGNTCTYAPYLAGKPQARAMRRIGWKKLTVVIMQQMKLIKAIFQSHIGRAIRQSGFRFK